MPITAIVDFHYRWQYLFAATGEEAVARATYVGAYDQDGYTLRCHGCLRAIGRCRCG